MKLINGDCLAVMKTLEDNSIDLTVTSPPYDNLRTYKGYTFDFEGIAKELYRVTKEGGIVVWVVGDATIKGSETGTSFKQALYFKEIGFNLHDTMIYQKNSYPFPPVNRYYQQFEYMFVLSKGKPKTYNIQRQENIWKQKNKHSSTQRNSDGTTSNLKYETGKDTRKMDNVWKIDTGYMRGTKDKIAFKHPATFPDLLSERHILSWSNEGDIVLDPMCGSGTTLKMAKKNNRNFIGIDCSEEYCKIAQARIGDIEIEQLGTVSETVKSKKPIEASKEIDNKGNRCPACGGKLKKTKYGKTCEDCLTDI
jgi:site-specific DNA-methyltransferase (adenine-specific)